MRLAILLTILFSVTGCRERTVAKSEPKELVLYCGTGIRDAAVELKRQFEADNSGVRISITYAGSGRLLGQLGAARTGDVFMPGSAFYVDQAIDEGWADESSRREVAYFIPVIVVPKGNPKGIAGLKDFLRPGLRVGLGDERSVAIGKRAVKLFKKSEIPYDLVKANVVCRSATVNELGVAVGMKNVDVAIMWDANAKHFSDTCDMIEIPQNATIISTIPIVTLTFSRHAETAKAFIDFAASEHGKKIFLEASYTVELKHGDK